MTKNRTNWGTHKWLAEAELIMATENEPLTKILPGHLAALQVTITGLREQVSTLRLTQEHQIRELGTESVLRDANGLVLEKQYDGDGSAAYWTASGNSDEIFYAETIALPATLLFRHP